LPYIDGISILYSMKSRRQDLIILYIMKSEVKISIIDSTKSRRRYLIMLSRLKSEVKISILHSMKSAVEISLYCQDLIILYSTKSEVEQNETKIQCQPRTMMKTMSPREKTRQMEITMKTFTLSLSEAVRKDNRGCHCPR
jgi:ABC-type molybdate transport system ATPase subunit